MANSYFILLLYAYFINVLKTSNGANILAVFPSVWKSHYLFGRQLLDQLSALQNHSITLISPHALGIDDQIEFSGNSSEVPANVTASITSSPISSFATNSQSHIREIRVNGLIQNWLEMGLSFDVETIRQKSVIERYTRLIYAGTTNADLLLSDAQVRKLLRSGECFDLLLVDLFLSDSLLGFAQFYQIPTVVVSPTGANTWINQMLGNPQNSALDPSNFLSYSERMSLWERSVNTLMGLFEYLTYNFFHMISQQAVYKKHFQSLCQLANIPLPHHRDLTKNLSLVLINSHPVIQYPRAYLPNMLEIAGAHLSMNPDKDLELPNHLKEFIEKAPKGVVYMSLGANVRTVDLARERLEIFLDVFTYLKDLRFLLKWEMENTDMELPKNVMINEWFPQEAILAHPNVKVFISSCGVMSIVESINGLTPLLVIPIYSKQEVAAKRLQMQGIAEIVPFDQIAYDSILYGIQQLAFNVSYHENIKNVRSLLGSSYGAPIAKSLHYIDLILKTNGGDFLKSHANHLNFLRTELVDVLAIITLGLIGIVAIPFLVTCCILKKSYHSQALRPKQTTKFKRITLNSIGRKNLSAANVDVTGDYCNDEIVHGFGDDDGDADDDNDNHKDVDKNTDDNNDDVSAFKRRRRCTSSSSNSVSSSTTTITATTSTSSLSSSTPASDLEKREALVTLLQEYSQQQSSQPVKNEND